MKLDQELLDAGIEVINEMSVKFEMKLPLMVRRHLAATMLQKNRLGDDKWCEDTLKKEAKKHEKLVLNAKNKNFYPFVFLGIGAFRWIRKNYGEWTLVLMREKLADPKEATKLWAIQFAATMREIGREECEKAENLYEFVAGHNELWEKTKGARKEWKYYVRSIEEKAKNREPKVIN